MLKKILSSQTATFEGKKKIKTGVAMSFKANKLSRNALKTCSTGKIPIRA